MSSPPQNQAAWLTAAKAKPLVVGDAPYTAPGPGQVVVKNGAVAINPIDWQKQMIGDLLLGYIKYPFILGGDVAGTVVEVGPGVQRFRVGDRVVGAAIGIAEASGDPKEGGFQLYTLVREYMASPIPDHITYEQACVLPLTLCTAAYGLFHPEFLGLNMPTTTDSPPPIKSSSDNNNKPVVIITGGSTSVGSNAVQLAVAAGYEVISTSSPKNFEYVRNLGASHVFSYKSKTLADDMLVALGGKDRTLAGCYAIGDGAVDVCTTILSRHPKQNVTRRFVAMAGGSPVGDELGTLTGKILIVAFLLWSVLKQAVRSYLAGVTVKFIDLKEACDPQGHVARVYTDFLPRALESGRFVPAPPPLVAGKGLGAVQGAMDLQMRGVSAQKVVVSL